MNTRDRVQKIVLDTLGVAPEKLTDEADFTNDLGADSLDIIELAMSFEEEFNITISDDETDGIQTYGQAVALIEKKVG